MALPFLCKRNQKLCFNELYVIPRRKPVFLQNGEGLPKRSFREPAPGDQSEALEAVGQSQCLRLFLVQEQHPEEELIKTKQDEVNAAWQRLKGLALQRQGKLFGAAEVQRFNRYRAGAGSRAQVSARRGRLCGMCP